MHFPWSKPTDEYAPCTSAQLVDDIAALGPDGKDHAQVARAGGAAIGASSIRARLSRSQKQTAVNMALQAAVLGYHHRDEIHYTQGARRWDGIDNYRKAWRGQHPTWADCSAYVTWCLWNGLDHFHVPDVVNGEAWRAGYTGTLLQHGWRVSSPLPGDAIIYGEEWPGEHTALYTGGGLVVSHGSESGPGLIPWRYRSDVLSIRRYI